MKFYCSSKLLTEALSTVTRALPQKSTNPVYENILIQTAEDSIYLTCSDERFTIRTLIEARIDEHGSMLVPGRLFNDVARFLPEGEVEVLTNASYQTRISLGGSRTNISGIDPTLFPRLPELSDGTDLILSQGMLRSMIEKTEFAVDLQNMREILTGEYIETDGNTVSIVALDGFRMAVMNKELASSVEKMKAIIPGKVISDLAKLLKDSEEEKAQLTFTGDKLAIVLGDTQLYTSLIGGEYVNYRQIVPKNFTTRVVVDTDEMKKCIDRAALIARVGSNNLVRFEISEDTLVMESHSDIADTRQELPITLYGSPLKVNFNVKYISDVLKNMESEKMEISLNTAVTPCVMRQDGDSGYYHLILPVRA